MFITKYFIYFYMQYRIYENKILDNDFYKNHSLKLFAY